ncbi:MAG: hypothetical protein JNM62_05235 [Flavobacteriales bacterium]|nr:hypothetical protein [Flavobacteriales bacterium]
MLGSMIGTGMANDPAEPLLWILAMKPNYRAPLTGARLPIILFVSCTLYVSGVAAQSETSDMYTISKTCLWNADRDTWSDLNLKRFQVDRLVDMRSRYPAVVGAQWVLEADEPTADMSGTVTSTANTGVGSTRALQKELRELLSPEQLKRWHQRCARPLR